MGCRHIDGTTATGSVALCVVRPITVVLAPVEASGTLLRLPISCHAVKVCGTVGWIGFERTLLARSGFRRNATNRRPSGSAGNFRSGRGRLSGFCSNANGTKSKSSFFSQQMAQTFDNAVGLDLRVVAQHSVDGSQHRIRFTSTRVAEIVEIQRPNHGAANIHRSS